MPQAVNGDPAPATGAMEEGERRDGGKSGNRQPRKDGKDARPVVAEMRKQSKPGAREELSTQGKRKMGGEVGTQEPIAAGSGLEGTEVKGGGRRKRGRRSGRGRRGGGSNGGGGGEREEEIERNRRSRDEGRRRRQQKRGGRGRGRGKEGRRARRGGGNRRGRERRRRGGKQSRQGRGRWRNSRRKKGRRRREKNRTILIQEIPRKNIVEKGRDGGRTAIGEKRKQRRQHARDIREPQLSGKSKEIETETLALADLLEHRPPSGRNDVTTMEDDKNGGRIERERRRKEREAEGANEREDQLVHDLLRRELLAGGKGEVVAQLRVMAAQVEHETLDTAQLAQGGTDGCHIRQQSGARGGDAARGRMHAEGEEAEAGMEHVAAPESSGPSAEIGGAIAAEAQHADERERNGKVRTVGGGVNSRKGRRRKSGAGIRIRKC